MSGFPKLLKLKADEVLAKDRQKSEAVKNYGYEVMRQLTAALMGSWRSGGNGEFFQEMRARVAMPTGSGQRQAQMP